MSRDSDMLLGKRILSEVDRQYSAALEQIRDSEGRPKAGGVAAAGARALKKAYRTSLVCAYRKILEEYSARDMQGLRDLARVYETLLDYWPGYSGKRRPWGSYYTPDEIITYIVGRSLGPIVRGDCRTGAGRGGGEPLSSKEILNLKILDPAMGSGLFLLEAARFLTAAYGKALVREGKTSSGMMEAGESESHRQRIAEACLYGVDINADAVHIAGLVLGLFAGRGAGALTDLHTHLRHGNSLLGAGFGENPETYEKLYRQHASQAAGRLETQGGYEATPGPFHWEREFPEVYRCRGGPPGSQPGFDAVVGNPPYLSYSGRHRAKDCEGVSATYRALGKAAGWITSHGLFMIRALDLVKQGGLISMIVPDQVGHLKGYGDLRRRMLERGHLVEVRYWGENVFGEVTTPSVTFVLRKSREGSAPQALMIDRQGNRLHFRPGTEEEWHWSPARQVFEDMVRRHTVLDGFSDPGVHTGNVVGKLIKDRRREGAVPVLEGKQIRAFHCSAPVRWLNRTYRRRTGEYFRASPERIYTETDIVVRQTADRPIAARHIHRCYFRNSVLALRVPEGFSVEYVLGILNSDAAAWLYRASAFESGQRTFPQVKVSRLRRIPIPDPALPANRRVVARIEKTVRTLETGGTSPEPESPLVRELNRAVWKLYGFEAPLPTE
jgi:hypothetical protein